MLAALAAVLVGALFSASPAAAANSIGSSTPADGSTVTSSPSSIQMKFTEALGQQNIVAVVCNGDPATTGAPQVGADLLTLTVPVTTRAAEGHLRRQLEGQQPGRHARRRRLVQVHRGHRRRDHHRRADGHHDATDEYRRFHRRHGSTPRRRSSSNNAVGDGPLGVMRLFSTMSVAVLLGSFVLIAMAWPEGVEYILTVRFLRITYYIAVASTVGFVICMTSQITGQSFGSSISPLEWKHLTDTGPGAAALVRLVFTVACVYVTMRPERLIDTSTHLAALAIPAVAVASMGFDRALGDLPVLGAIAGVAHVLGMAVWFGGLVLLARVVLAGPGESDLVHAVRGFSRISTPAIIVTVASGVVQTWRLDRSGLFSTGHGYVMLLKTVAVAVMIFIGVAARQFVTERLTRVEVMSAPTANRLRRAFGFEAIVGVIVLVLSSWLLALTPAHAASSSSTANKDLGVPQLIRNADNGVEVQVRFTQVVGPNAVRVDVLQAPAGLHRPAGDLHPADRLRRRRRVARRAAHLRVRRRAAPRRRASPSAPPAPGRSP